MGFRRGQLVVYPKYGVGKVVKSEERPVFGRRQRCLEIRFSTDNRRVFIQEDEFQRAHIRPVMGTKVLRSVYQVLKAPPEYHTVKVANRRLERYRSKAEIGDPMSLAEVARDLVRRGSKHRLNEHEKTLAESTVELLTEEIAHVENASADRVKKKIERMLGSPAAR